LFTSESVTEGHPDKIADQISDSILDALIKDDPKSRVAVETLITTGQVHVAGEVTTEAWADIPNIVREVILGADKRMTEQVQYGTITFTCKDNMASFVQVANKHVTLMFNRGQLIQDKAKHPHLEGTGPNARFMRFADETEAKARTSELNDLSRRWCDLMTQPKKKTSGR